MVKEYQAKGWPCFTNINIKEVEPLDIEKFRHKGYHDCVIGYDELHTIIDKRRSSSGTNLDYTDVFDQCRKLGIKLVGTEKLRRLDFRAQDDIDLKARAHKILLDPNEECFDLANWGRLAGAKYIWTRPGSSRFYPEWLSWTDLKPYFQIYNTREVVQSQYVKPKIIIEQTTQGPISRVETPSPISVKDVTRTQRKPRGHTSDQMGGIIQMDIYREILKQYPNAVNSFEEAEPDIVIHEAQQVIAVKAFTIYTPSSDYGVDSVTGKRKHVGAETRWLSREMVGAEYVYAWDHHYSLTVWNRPYGGPLLGKQAKYVISNDNLSSFEGVLVKWEDHK
jgi:hypothetical protein